MIYIDRLYNPKKNVWEPIYYDDEGKIVTPGEVTPYPTKTRNRRAQYMADNTPPRGRRDFPKRIVKPKHSLPRRHKPFGYSVLRKGIKL